MLSSVVGEKDMIARDLRWATFMLKAHDHVNAVLDLEELMKTKSVGYSVYDLAQQNESVRAIILIIDVFSYGFIIIISLSAVANITNVVGNIVISVILCRLIGIAGIGAASFIGTLLKLIISFTHLLKKGNSLHIKPALSLPVLGEIAKYSIIDAGSYLFLSIFVAAMNKFVMAVFGEDMLILVSVCVFLKEAQLVFDGIGEAFSPLISIYLGEETYEGVRECYRLSEKTSIVEGLVMTVITVLAAPLIVRVFGISDPRTASYAVNGIRIMSLGLTFISLMYLITSYYLLRGKILLGLVICCMRDVAASVIFAVTGGLLFGIAVSSAAAYLLLMGYLDLRYGREDTPLLLKEIEGNGITGFYELNVKPEDIICVQKEIEQLLKDNNVSEKTTVRVKLLIEDLYMLIYEKNGSEGILGECVVKLLDEGVSIITRDDGVLFDISQDDVEATSVAAFTVSAYMEKMKENRRHLTTMSYNRNSFLVKYSR